MTQWTGTLRLDVETYSTVDLSACGVYKYVASPDYELLLLGYRFNGQTEASCFDLKTTGQLPPEEVLDALYDPRVLKLAWNAAFELATIGEYLRRMGLAPLDPAQWRCTMVRSLMTGLPQKLSEAGKAARVPAADAKFAFGRQLVKYFCLPCKPTKVNGGRTRNLPEHDPEKWELFKQYCAQDVIAEAGVDDVIMGFPVDEREFARWHRDIAMNVRGIQADPVLVQNAIAMNATVEERNLARLAQLTGVDNPRSVAQLKDWLEARDGEKIESLNKKLLPELIAGSTDDVVKEALKLRQLTSLSSIKKYLAIDRAMGVDSRVRGLFQFYGANRTGREAGRLVQFQNLKTNTMVDLDMARELVLEGNLEKLEMFFGNVAPVLSQLIRTAFVAKPGHVLVPFDLKSIEARVLAWLADETWRLEVFRTHGLIYEASASQMFRVPMEEFLEYEARDAKHPLRKKGKVAELACGFQGASPALIRMGALDEGLEVAELDGIVSAWRAKSPRIASFDGGLWDRFGKAAFDCVAKGRRVDVAIGPRDGRCKVTFQLVVQKGRRAMYIWLPSGRPLVYWNPSIRIGGKFKRECVSYEGYRDDGLWGNVDTYGGKLTENVTQAIARDVIYLALDHCENELVGHVHDEGVPEVKAEDAEAYLDAVVRFIRQPISWAPGLPVDAERETMRYYRKGE